MHRCLLATFTTTGRHLLVGSALLLVPAMMKALDVIFYVVVDEYQNMINNDVVKRGNPDEAVRHDCLVCADACWMGCSVLHGNVHSVE